MNTMKVFRRQVSLACGVWIGVSCWSTAAEFQIGDALKPTDDIEKVSIWLEIGMDGDGLDEPVALDLGLGFPLWL